MVFLLDVVILNDVREGINIHVVATVISRLDASRIEILGGSILFFCALSLVGT